MPRPARFHAPAPQPERVLRLPEVVALIGLKRASVYSMMAAGQFPRPIRLSARAVAWRFTDLQAWLATREAA